MGQKDHNSQTVCEHLAASYLNHSHAVVSVLTDLKLSWTFSWLAGNKDGTRMALHKLKLQDTTGAAKLAKYILESFNKESRRNTLPNTFVNLLSYQDHNCKQKHIDSGDGGSGGCSGKTVDRDSAGQKHPPPTSGPGGSSSGMQFHNNGPGMVQVTTTRQWTRRRCCVFLSPIPIATLLMNLTYWTWWMNLSSSKSSATSPLNILSPIYMTWQTM